MHKPVFDLTTSYSAWRGALGSLFLSLIGVTSAVSGNPEPVKGEPAAPVDEKTAHEVSAADERFIQAIQKRDSVSLNKLLSEDYVSSEEGSDWAISKRGALVRCDAGKLTAYVFGPDRRFYRDRQAIVIEGDAGVSLGGDRDAGEASERLRVRRWWFKQEDRWILAAQMLPHGASELEKKRVEPN